MEEIVRYAARRGVRGRAGGGAARAPRRTGQDTAVAPLSCAQSVVIPRPATTTTVSRGHSSHCSLGRSVSTQDTVVTTAPVTGYAEEAHTNPFVFFYFGISPPLTRTFV